VIVDFPLEQAREHAEGCYPMEAAGLFVERPDGHVEFFPCGMSGRANQFAIPPHKWLEAEQKGRIAGVFHTHVNEPPLPSEWDCASLEAWGLPWVIMSVPAMEHAQFEPQGGKAPRPLLGRRFSHGTADCYGLIRDYYSKLGIFLPDFQREERWWERGGNLYLDNYAKAGFVRVKNEGPHLHDVLLMQINSKVPCHGAIYIGDNRLLHHLEGQLSARAVWGDFYRKATTHIFRHKDFYERSIDVDAD